MTAAGSTSPKTGGGAKWVDPLGENTKFSQVDPRRRRYKTEGAWERYAVRIGNLLFLMMSDINEPSQKVGRGTLGGNPGGVVTGETFRWWKRMVESNRDKIIISAHHYMLKNTTVASGEWEGMRKDENGTGSRALSRSPAIESPGERAARRCFPRPPRSC
jgi:hypothetical protein